MKARTAWLLGLGAAIVAALGFLRRPAAPPPAPPAPVGPDPRAEQLRVKLAESRAAVEEMERERAAEAEAEPEPEPEPPAPEPEPEPEPAQPEGVEERRKRVHERGQAAARKMRRPPEPPARS